MSLLHKYYKLDKTVQSKNNKGKHICLVLKSAGKPCNVQIAYYGNTSARVTHLKCHKEADDQYEVKLREKNNEAPKLPTLKQSLASKLSYDRDSEAYKKRDEAVFDFIIHSNQPFSIFLISNFLSFI